MLVGSSIHRKDFVNPLTDQLKRYRLACNSNALFICLDLSGTGNSLTNPAGNELYNDEREVSGIAVLCWDGRECIQLAETV